MQADVMMIDGAAPNKKDKQKAKAKELATSDIESIYEADPDQGSGSSSSAVSDIEMADDEFLATPLQIQPQVAERPIVIPGQNECGLCGTCHGPGQCAMTQKSENLVAYRQTLVMHAADESWADRVSVSKI